MLPTARLRDGVQTGIWAVGPLSLRAAPRDPMHFLRTVDFTLSSFLPSTCPGKPLPRPHLASSAGSYECRAPLWQCQEILVLILKGKGEKGLQGGPESTEQPKRKAHRKRGAFCVRGEISKKKPHVSNLVYTIGS